MSSSDLQCYLKLARIFAPVKNLGPGNRIGIWVQGCGRRCDGCISPSMQNSDDGKLLNIKSLAKIIANIAEQYDGITISGGEPFDQYKQLMLFCAYLKAFSGIEIGVYTGYTLNELKHKNADKAFMSIIDWIVDGHYDENQPDDSCWRGSKNQKMYKFVNGNVVENKNGFKSQKWSMAFENESIILSGIPKKDDLKKIEAYLKKQNIEMRLV